MFKLNFALIILILFMGRLYSYTPDPRKNMFNQMWQYSPMNTYIGNDNKKISVKTFSRVVWFDSIPLVTTRATLVELNNVKDKSSSKDLESEIKKSFPDIKDWKVTRDNKFTEFSGNWKMVNKKIRLLYYKHNDRSFAITATSDNNFRRINDLDVDILFGIFKKYYVQPEARSVFMRAFDWMVGVAYAQSGLLTSTITQVLTGGSPAGSSAGVGGSTPATSSSSPLSTTNSGSVLNPASSSSPLALIGNGNQVITLVDQDNLGGNLADASTNLRYSASDLNAAALTFDHASTTMDHSTTVLDHSATTLDRSANTLDHSATTLDRSATTLDRSATTLDRSATTIDHSATTLDHSATTISTATGVAGTDARAVANTFQQTSLQAGTDAKIVTNTLQQTSKQAGDDAKEVSRTLQETSKQAGEDAKSAAATLQQTSQQAGVDAKETARIMAQATHEGSEATKYAADKVAEATHETNETLRYLVKPEVVAKAAFAASAGAALGSLAVNLAVEGVTSVVALMAKLFENKDKMRWQEFQQALVKWRGEKDNFIANVASDFGKFKTMDDILKGFPAGVPLNQDLLKELKKEYISNLTKKQIMERDRKKILDSDCVDCYTKLENINNELPELEQKVNSMAGILGKIQNKEVLEMSRASFCNSLNSFKSQLKAAMDAFKTYRMAIRTNIKAAMSMVQQSYEDDSKKNITAAETLADANKNFNGMINDFDNKYINHRSSCEVGEGEYGQKAMSALKITKSWLIQNRMQMRSKCKEIIPYRNQAGEAARQVATTYTLEKGPYIESMIDFLTAANQAQAEENCYNELYKVYPPEKNFYVIEMDRAPLCKQSPSAQNVFDIFTKIRQCDSLLIENGCRQ